MLEKYSQLLAKIQETIPTATMKQVEGILAGGDEQSVLLKPSKLQSVLTEVAKMQIAANESAMAVVESQFVPTDANKEAPIAPTKKKSSRLTKAQRLEMTQSQQATVSASTDSKMTIEMGRQVAETKGAAIGIDQFTTELAEYQGDLIVGMESSIATKLTAYLDEAGDVGRIGLGSMVQNAATSVLDGMYASLAE